MHLQSQKNILPKTKYFSRIFIFSLYLISCKRTIPNKYQPLRPPWAASSPMNRAFRPLTASYKFSCFSPLYVMIFFLDTVQIAVKGKTG